jgi:hypothetical protein
MTKERKIIKAKVGLLELAKQLGQAARNVSQAGNGSNVPYVCRQTEFCKSGSDICSNGQSAAQPMSLGRRAVPIGPLLA